MNDQSKSIMPAYNEDVPEMARISERMAAIHKRLADTRMTMAASVERFRAIDSSPMVKNGGPTAGQGSGILGAITTTLDGIEAEICDMQELNRILSRIV